MRPPQNRIVERGYAFVPLPASVHRTVREEARHDRRLPGCWSGRIRVELTCEQPIHVGSGFRTLEEDDSGRFKVHRETTRSRGRPVASGSSLKGVLRARYEAITHSCLLFRVPKDVPAQAPELEACKTDPRVEEDPMLCPACALFGMMSRRARLSVEDFAVVGEARVEVAKRQEQFEPNPDQLVFPGRGELKGRKFAAGLFQTEPPMAPRLHTVEVLPRGTRLSGALRLLNGTPAEIGGLLAALGIMPESRLKIGGGKGIGGEMYDEALRKEAPTGFGRVVVTTVDLAGLRSPGAGGALTTEAARSAFEGSDDRFPEGEGRLVEIHGRDC